MPYLHSNNRRSLDYFNKSVSVEFGLLAVCHRLNHMGMLKCIASEKKPGQAVDAEHKFEKKPIHRRYLWKSKPEIRPQMRQRYSRNGHFLTRREELWNLDSRIR